MTLQIRKYNYRGQGGYLICGKVDYCAFPQSVFTTTRESAEKLRIKMLAGDDFTADDWTGGE